MNHLTPEGADKIIADFVNEPEPKDSQRWQDITQCIIEQRSPIGRCTDCGAQFKKVLPDMPDLCGFCYGLRIPKTNSPCGCIPTKTQTVILKADGSIHMIGSDTLGLEEHGATAKRASNILPLNPVKRSAFMLLRYLFGETGRVAGWTRTWDGPWVCELFDSNGQSFCSHSRSACVEWEVNKLKERLLK